MRQAIRFAVSASFLALATIGLAFSPSLSAQQIQAAIKAGSVQVSPRHGYSWKGYLLKQFDDGLNVPKNSVVDAVVVATPFERLQFQSYLETYQGQPLSQAAASKLASRYRDTIAFLVFAHTPSSATSQRGFLNHFGPGYLTISGQASALRTKAVKQDGPSYDYFQVTGVGTRFRWLGDVIYTFNLASLVRAGVDVHDLRGNFRFTDMNGKQYQIPFNLAEFR